MEREKDFNYEVKCRRCSKISKMWFGNSRTTDKNKFHTWALEHSTFPINKQCNCNNGAMMFHDLVSFDLTAVLP